MAVPVTRLSHLPVEASTMTADSISMTSDINNLFIVCAILGTIVGSIAEQIWGIPEEFKEKALAHLTDEMRDVVNCFYDFIIIT